MIVFLLMSCQPEIADSGAPVAALICDNPPSYEEWTEGFLKGKCQPCHAANSPNRYGAPENIFFDSEEASLYWISSIERTTLERETMPPSGGVTEDEKELLRRWIDCVAK